jgi:trk system potassium uptake protein TrkA
MRVLILGGGAVGTLVAKRLVREKNEVIIVENDPEHCSALEDSLDAKIVQGDASSIKTLERAGLVTADMLIAVTSRDTVNVLGCLIAQAFSNVRIKVARLRTHEVDRWRSIFASKLLGVDLVIHPDSETSGRILQVIGLPGVSDIVQFSEGSVKLFGMTIEKGSWLEGIRISELDQSDPSIDFLIAMIFRESRVIIPRGDDVMEAGDHIYVVVPEAQLEQAFDFMGVDRQEKVERVFILGGKQLGIEAALQLEKKGIQVKLFERDLERCEKIATVVKDTVVVHADGTDQQILIEENVRGIDAYLALTGDDEVNIISSLLAKRLGSRKGVALVNRIDFLPMAQLLGISSTFSTRLIVVDRILQYVRKGNVVSVTTFREEEAEAIELVASPGSKFVGKALKDVRFPTGALVGAIVRPTGEVIIPRGDSVISVEDQVIFFCLESLIPKLEKAFIF